MEMPDIQFDLEYMLQGQVYFPMKNNNFTYFAKTNFKDEKKRLQRNGVIYPKKCSKSKFFAST